MRRLLLVVLSVGSSALAACGGDDAAGGASNGCLDGTSGEVTIVAEDLAWDADCIDAVADGPLEFTVDNQDRGVPHNLHLRDAPGEPATELEEGPVVQTLEVELPEGDYEYVCDIHPNMLGTLRMAAANPEGG
ncbi:MAG: cupredoxin domain-containing protein [Acidimicrobiia bacterium]